MASSKNWKAERNQRERKWEAGVYERAERGPRKEWSMERLDRSSQNHVTVKRQIPSAEHVNRNSLWKQEAMFRNTNQALPQ